jgi:hypothetical protein
MHKHQPNQRIAAARAFMDSLDQLQDILAQEHQIAESESPSSGNCSSNSSTGAEVLEEAAADLETFFGDTQSLEEGMLGEERGERSSS